MERLTSGSDLPAAKDLRDVVWVPDAEVTECICGRKFGYHIRKHHCRSCGRVFCGRCTDSKVQIQEGGKFERVCDNCARLRRHDETGSISQKQSTNKQIEASLKADLRMTLEHNRWFRGFLIDLNLETIGKKKPNGQPNGQSAEFSP